MIKKIQTLDINLITLYIRPLSPLDLQYITDVLTEERTHLQDQKSLPHQSDSRITFKLVKQLKENTSVNTELMGICMEMFQQRDANISQQYNSNYSKDANFEERKKTLYLPVCFLYDLVDANITSDALFSKYFESKSIFKMYSGVFMVGELFQGIIDSWFVLFLDCSNRRLFFIDTRHKREDAMSPECLEKLNTFQVNINNLLIYSHTIEQAANNPDVTQPVIIANHQGRGRGRGRTVNTGRGTQGRGDQAQLAQVINPYIPLVIEVYPHIYWQKQENNFDSGIMILSAIYFISFCVPLYTSQEMLKNARYNFIHWLLSDKQLPL